MRKLTGFTALTTLLFSFPALAAPYTYAPPSCDFSITFPEKPFIEKKCSAKQTTDCDEVVTYTQMQDAAALSFRVTCNKADPKDMAFLTPEDLKKTLAGLVKEANLEPFADDNATLDNGVKTSVVFATGKRNERDVVYTGEIWLGKASVMTMEGEMSGPENKAINDIYTNIVKSVKSKADPEPKKKP